LTQVQYNALTPVQRTNLWRITNTLFSLCNSISSDECKIDDILAFYTNYKYDNVYVTNIKDALNKDRLEEALNALKAMRISGGNQKGGNLAQIATLLAGIDAAVLNISSLTVLNISSLSEAAYKTLCELCQKAAGIISRFSLSNCLRIIMGDILYTCVKNVIDVAMNIQPELFEIGARATIGLLGPYAVYSNRMALLNVLRSMISYLPQAGGLFLATVAGVIIFNTSMQVIDKAPSVAETSIILKEYIYTLNNLDASDIVTGFNKLQDIITEHLAAATRANDVQKKQELEEFSVNITQILNNAGLAPEPREALRAQRVDQYIMTINIRIAIFDKLQKQFADCSDIKVPGCLDRAKQIVELGDAIKKYVAVINTTITDASKQIKVDEINVDAIRATVTAEEERLTEEQRSAEEERRRAINKAIADRINRDATINPKTMFEAANKLNRRRAETDLNAEVKAEAIRNEFINAIKNRRENIDVTRSAEEDTTRQRKSNLAAANADNNINMVVEHDGGKPRRKTTRKPHKKPHKKSRKHRRSRKH
jgi:hypothetical protein